jgi:hypothetical protein
MRRLPARLPAPGVVHFFGESVIPCHDRMGGRTANECLTTNKRISAPHSLIHFCSWTVCSGQAGKPVLRLFAICGLHSLIRFLFVDGLLRTGWKACSTAVLRHPPSAFVDSFPIREQSARKPASQPMTAQLSPKI